MNRNRAWSVTKVLLVGLAAITGAESEVRAQFRMLQNFNSGMATTGYNEVFCNDPNGFTHWNTRAISIYHNTANQGAGKATALQAAMQSWTNVPDTSYVLTYAGTTSSGFVTDGKSTMLWGTTSGCTGGCLALTALVLQQPGQRIIEADIVFSDFVTWTTNGSQYDTQAVATHELGHLLGIAHHANAINGPQTMSPQYFNGLDMRSLHADDIASLHCSEYRYCPTTATPAPPLSLTVYSGSCYGQNDLNWTATCEGTTRYELYRSLSSNFSSQTLEYSGLNLSKLVNVSQTTYFRVRACNANGCGGYRVANAPAKVAPGCW